MVGPGYPRGREGTHSESNATAIGIYDYPKIR